MVVRWVRKQALCRHVETGGIIHGPTDAQSSSVSTKIRQVPAIGFCTGVDQTPLLRLNSLTTSKTGGRFTQVDQSSVSWVTPTIPFRDIEYIKSSSTLVPLRPIANALTWTNVYSLRNMECEPERYLRVPGNIQEIRSWPVMLVYCTRPYGPVFEFPSTSVRYGRRPELRGKSRDIDTQDFFAFQSAARRIAY